MFRNVVALSVLAFGLTLTLNTATAHAQDDSITLQYRCVEFRTKAFASRDGATTFMTMMNGHGFEVSLQLQSPTKPGKINPKLPGGSGVQPTPGTTYIVKYRLTSFRTKTFSGQFREGNAASFRNQLVSLGCEVLPVVRAMPLQVEVQYRCVTEKEQTFGDRNQGEDLYLKMTGLHFRTSIETDGSGVTHVRYQLSTFRIKTFTGANRDAEAAAFIQEMRRLGCEAFRRN